MQTPSQILRAKIIKKMEYKEMLEEELTIMVKEHSNLLNKELNEKYKPIIERKKLEAKNRKIRRKIKSASKSN